MPKKSAIQKRDAAPAPRVEVLSEPKGANYPPGRMLISSLSAIAELKQGPSTLGQMTHTLYAVGGQYRRNMRTML